ncbi:hypothetical protein BDR22DRAFT_846012 [Usnea florida]
MAKGLRSSRNKANNSRLRSKVFAPVESARKERLSSKLHELASKPETTFRQCTNMTDGVKATTREASKESEAYTPASKEEMNIDQAQEDCSTVKQISRNTRRVEKRSKARAAMVFPVYRKGQRVGPRLRRRERQQSIRA